MSEPGQIKSFGDLGKVLDQKKHEEAKGIFEKVMRGKIDKFPKAHFESALPEVREINVLPFKPQTGKPAIYATIYYETEDGKEKHFTMNCFEDGVISGRIPGDVAFTRDELETDIMNTIESTNVDLLHETKLPIVPDSDEGKGREVNPDDEDIVKVDKPLARPERIRFLDQQEGLLMVFYNPNQGFNSYKVWLFATRSGKLFGILETDEYGNAAFIVDSEEQLDVDPEKLKKPASMWIDPEERDEIVERVWKPFSSARTRRELRAQGAKRVVHQGESWQERLQEEIDKRMVITQE